MTIIADTGPIAALFNPKDQWHEWAVEISKNFLPSTTLITCEAVLTEVFFLLRPSSTGLKNFVIISHPPR